MRSAWRGPSSFRVAATLLLAFLGAWTFGASAAVADDAAWSAPVADRGVLHGVVLDDEGRPAVGATVAVRAWVQSPDAGGTSWTADTVADDHGRYRIVLRADDGVEAGSLTATSDFGAAYLGSQTRPAWPGAGKVTRADLRVRRLSARISGRVRIRGGAPAGEQLSVSVSVPDAARSPEVDLSDDGRWAAVVPAGDVSIAAFSRYGLPGTFLGPQPEGGPSRNRVVLAPGEVRGDVDLELRARLPYYAVDQYGMPHHGSEPQDRITEPMPRYAVDETRRLGSTTGPIARTGPFQMPLGSRVDGVEPWLALPWGFNRYEIPIENAGDDDLWIRAVRFEGRDAALFRCEPHVATWYVLPCGTGLLNGGRHAVLEPGHGGGWALPIIVDQDVYRDTYEATAVIETNAQSGPIRVPMRVVNRTALIGLCAPAVCPPAAAGPGAAAGAPAAGASGSTTARRAIRPSAVGLTRRRVTIAVPVAGRAAIRVDAARTRGGRPAWKTVRRSTLTARRPGHHRVAVRALPAGRYRVVVRFTPRGATRAATLTRAVRLR